MVCRFVTREDWLRRRVERHVRQVYHRAYGAVVREFPDLMVADLDEAHGVRSAAGLRGTATGFFSECYLDQPLDAALSDLAGEPVGRERIIEVTSLASTNFAAMARLVAQIVDFARSGAMDWAVFTITPRLQRLLCRMDLPIVVLCAAQACRVANPEDWGRYYETGPVVAAMPDPALAADVPIPDRQATVAAAPAISARA
jgi:hypothetical protein